MDAVHTFKTATKFFQNKTSDFRFRQSEKMAMSGGAVAVV